MINLLLFFNIIFCDIKGEVKNPGVYQVSEAYIQSVIELAGGLTKKADTSRINLSKKVEDEMVIYIPSKKSELICDCPLKIINCSEENNTIMATSTPPSPTTTTTTLITTTSKTTSLITTTTRIPVITTTKAPTKININTATLSELTSLKGIGNVIAERIIEYRNEDFFDKIDDLLNVKGIGESLFAQIKDFITV